VNVFAALQLVEQLEDGIRFGTHRILDDYQQRSGALLAFHDLLERGDRIQGVSTTTLAVQHRPARVFGPITGDLLADGTLPAPRRSQQCDRRIRLQALEELVGQPLRFPILVTTLPRKRVASLYFGQAKPGTPGSCWLHRLDSPAVIGVDTDEPLRAQRKGESLVAEEWGLCGRLERLDHLVS
jgi:hypothetical protein